MSSEPKKITIEKFDRAMAPAEAPNAGLRWHSPQAAPFHVAGFGWFAAERRYRRMPAHPAEKLPEAVDSLANCTAGGQIRFQARSAKLFLRVTLTGPHDMCHMPATGQCGFDCYLGAPGEQRYFSTTKYKREAVAYEVPLFEFPTPEWLHVTLNFPLYQGVQEVLLGLDPDAEIRAPAPYRHDRPVVVYGTSITQGGCACRPGMAYTNILSRRLNLEFINLGFSGNGRGEPEVARMIATLPEPACFVLDYEANCTDPEQLRKTLPEFIRILRAAHPRVPLLVISRIPYAAEDHKPVAHGRRLERREIQSRCVEALRQAGDTRVFFHDGSNLLGTDFDECTVDGSHPTDLGFMRMAEGLEPVFRKILFE